ncbi:disease resistance protein RGA2 [Prunus yedoensis var. nudiflora]|uniref:Disease resistance protein RGA2 n=1 Tax=Prunus yedoensis var. nudiflora TaxID=2094558 RepID=A0A314YBB1_PRUYE|nr:disease resistance protein RGA2 [Prunus yedoensis var. nudiflora]
MMTSLRHLNLVGCVSLSSMPLEIRSLRQLQTLPLFVVNRVPGALNTLEEHKICSRSTISWIEVEGKS